MLFKCFEFYIVSHKVKMLETVVVNLANKLGEETRILKEDSKAIRSEIKSLKPSFADLFKNREVEKTRNVENNSGADNRRASKRSRVEDDHATDVPMGTRDEVFDDDFQTQQKRGFLNGGGRGGGHQDGQGGRRPGGGGGGNEVPRDRRQTWRQKLPNITGNSGDNGFAAPIDLFVFNVNVDVSEEGIKTHMKESKGLDILEIVKVSHAEARTKSFRVKVKSEDYEKAMDCQTWPSRVRVRPYRHFKQRRDQPGGQFGGQGGASGNVEHGGHDGNNSQA